MPAVPIFVDSRHRFFMAAPTVLLHDDRSFLGALNRLRNSPRIEHKGIPHPFIPFPGQVPGQVIVRKMAIDALQATVPSVMKPVFVFGLHDMATGAEIRAARSGIKSRRTETYESY